MYDWEKNLPKVREQLKKEREERNKAEIEVNKRLLPYDFTIGIVLLIVLVVTVVVLQPTTPECGDYQQIASKLRDEGFWIDASGSPSYDSGVLYQHYQSPTNEKVAVVNYRAERETCVVDCSDGQCDIYRTWMQTYR